MTAVKTRATKDAIIKKAHRLRNPVTTVVGLAREFDAPVYTSETGSTKTSGAFSSHVRKTLGSRDYKKFLNGTL